MSLVEPEISDYESDPNDIDKSYNEINWKELGFLTSSDEEENNIEGNKLLNSYPGCNQFFKFETTTKIKSKNIITKFVNKCIYNFVLYHILLYPNTISNTYFFIFFFFFFWVVEDDINDINNCNNELDYNKLDYKSLGFLTSSDEEGNNNINEEVSISWDINALIIEYIS